MQGRLGWSGLGLDLGLLLRQQPEMNVYLNDAPPITYDIQEMMFSGLFRSFLFFSLRISLTWILCSEATNYIP